MSELYKGRPTPPGDYFPYTDLSESDASLLKPILKDGNTVAECHKSIDAFYPLYKMGHSALELLALDIGLDEEKRISFLHGITLYEITATVARPWAPRYSKPTTYQHIQQVKYLAETPELVGYVFEDAFASFAEKQSNTMKLIVDSVGHDEFFDPHFVLQGAATIRSLETGIIEDATIS